MLHESALAITSPDVCTDFSFIGNCQVASGKHDSTLTSGLLLAAVEVWNLNRY